MCVNQLIPSARLLAAVLLCAGVAAAEKDNDLPQSVPDRFGQFYTLESRITDAQIAQVGNLAAQLQARAVLEHREAVLILEIPPGSSRFGQVTDLAKKLTSADVSNVRTVAWLPETVEGPHAILAVACDDIVMNPDASLGNIGGGSAVPQEDQNLILSIVDRRGRNSRLYRGVVQAMMDPAVELLRVRLEGDAGVEQQRFLTQRELKLLQNKNTVISATETIKDLGAPGTFRADNAQRAGFLVAKTVTERHEVAAIYGLPRESMRERHGADGEINARLIELHEAITPFTEEFILRQIHTATAEGANLLIIDIDSPGGYLDSSVNIANTLAELDPKKVETVAWVHERALSGAAIVAMGTDRIIMSPGAQLGDAGVIRETEEGGAFEHAPEKIRSPLLVTLGNLAERKNRPPALLQAMVDMKMKVYEVTNVETGRVTYKNEDEIKASEEEWEKGPIVVESRDDFFLTVSGARAHELGLAEAPCDNMDELRIRLGIAEDKVLQAIGRTWVDTFVFVLRTQFAGFGLITLAILCIYVELHIPSGLFGIMAAVFFTLFFWSRYLGGTSGSLELIMFVLGLGLLAMEIFVVPGFGVFGVSGLMLMAGALVMASHTFSGMTAGERFDESMSSLGSLAGALVTVIAVAMFLNRFLPSIPVLNRLILTPPGYATVDESAPHLDPSVYESRQSAGPVTTGDIGIAASTLRPSGKASFGDNFMDVVSDGGYIDHGTQVEVIRVAGNRIIVRAVDSHGIA
jgi:membrane-bound serine protease (ClpP class)